MTQLGLNLGHPDHWQELRELVRQAVAAISLKEIAYRCDSSPSALADAIAERDRKGLRAEHLVAILHAAPESSRQAILEAIVAPLGYKVERVAPLKPEEENRLIRAFLEKNAPGLLPALTKELGR